MFTAMTGTPAAVNEGGCHFLPFLVTGECGVVAMKVRIFFIERSFAILMKEVGALIWLNVSTFVWSLG